MIQRQSVAVRAAVLFAFFLLGIVLIYATVDRFNVERPSTENLPKVGEMAPNFSLRQLDGPSVQLNDYRGKSVILVFFGTYSAVSRQQLTAIQSGVNQWKKQGIDLIAVDVGEDPVTVRAYAENHGITFPIVLDRDRSITLNKYRIEPIPVTFLIDPSGQIRERTVSFVPDSVINTWLTSTHAD